MQWDSSLKAPNLIWEAMKEMTFELRSSGSCKEEKKEYRVQRGEREGPGHSGNWKSTVTRGKARLKGGKGQAWSERTASLLRKEQPDNERTCPW